jgi:Cellulase (glycosyl hydrolase family 5)
MRRLLLASTMLAFAVSAHAQSASLIQPGSGSITDASGNVWSISATGSIQENGQWVAGGGGTAELTIDNGVVYGLDAHGRGWFTLNASGQDWSQSAAPTGMAASTSPGSATDTTATTTTPTAAASPCTGPVSGTFTIANGKIIGPNGQPFIAKGVDLWAGDMPTVQASLTTMFPGVNMVRVYDASYQDPSSYASFINAMTAQGIVVAIVDAWNGAGNGGGGKGVAFTGQTLLTQQAWYQTFAATYINNPYVWFGPNNEPPAAGLTAWQQESYNTIRSSGNNNVIMFDLPGGGYPGNTIEAYGMDTSIYAKMTNIVLDPHYYGWASGYSTDQGTNNSAVASLISGAQLQTANGIAPEIIGEYGNSTNGSSIDANWQQVVTAVNTSGVGATAWATPSGGGAGDILVQNGSLTPFGQMVAGYVKQSSGAVAGGVSSACAALAGNPAALAAADTAAIDGALTGTPQAGATPLVLSLGGVVAPTPAAPADTAADPTTSTAPPVTIDPATQAVIDANLASAAATAQQAATEAANPAVQQQIDQATANLQAAQALLSGVQPASGQ